MSEKLIAELEKYEEIIDCNIADYQLIKTDTPSLKKARSKGHWEGEQELLKKILVRLKETKKP